MARSAGLRELSADIDQDLWDKRVMLAAGAAVTCLMRGAGGEIMAASGGRAIMRQAMDDCAAVAGASGRALVVKTLEQIHGRLLDATSG